MTNTQHLIEAECGNCGEHYNPESLENGYVEHYACEEIEEGLGKPRQVWIYSLTEMGEMVMKEVLLKKKFKIKWSEVAAMVLACSFAVWAAWVIFG